MVVPQLRLIFWTALIFVPFAIVGGAVPGTLPVAAAAVGLFFLVALLDALRAPSRVRGIQISCDPVVRLQKDREGVVPFVITRAGAPGGLLRLGIAFPEAAGSNDVDHVVRLSPTAERSELSWPCKPTQRGLYHLERVYFEVESPLGFWASRSSQAIACELRIYPNMAEERRQVAAVFLRRRNSGAHIQAHAGQGREFNKLRGYQPGDSLSDIHWKATAKRGGLVSKVFQVERSHEVYVVIDASRLSARRLARTDGAQVADFEEASVENDVFESDEGTPTALERCITAALVLGHAAEQQGDQFGLITFSDRVISFVRARSGQAHHDAVRDRLYTLQPEVVSPDYEELCSFIRLRLRKRALLIFLTNLDDPALAESFVKASDLISRQHLLLVNMLRQPATEPLFESADGVQEPGDIYGKLAGHLRWHQLLELQKVLQRRGVRFRIAEPDKLVGDLIAQHSDVRARQLV